MLALKIAGTIAGIGLGTWVGFKLVGIGIVLCFGLLLLIGLHRIVIVVPAVLHLFFTVGYGFPAVIDLLLSVGYLIPSRIYLLLGGFELVFGGIELSLNRIELSLAYLQLCIGTSKGFGGIEFGSLEFFVSALDLALSRIDRVV